MSLIRNRRVGIVGRENSLSCDIGAGNKFVQGICQGPSRRIQEKTVEERFDAPDYPLFLNIPSLRVGTRQPEYDSCSSSLNGRGRGLGNGYFRRVTEFEPLFATQILVPSKAIPWGLRPTK